ncbi:PAS domain-containing protein, partial [Loktanella sp. DJP18]|uniref:PAS domain-containing protein n=1 Tax=Loktanella sp. DJP18 TaxID=3409788 RepID=UPI003BB5F2BC
MIDVKLSYATRSHHLLRQRCPDVKFDIFDLGYRMFRFIIENAPLGVLAVDAKGIILFHNVSAAEILYLNSNTMIGMPIHNAVPGLALRDGALIVVMPFM